MPTKFLARFAPGCILSWSIYAWAASPLDATQQTWVQQAERHDKKGWIYVHLEGAPYARGFQYGYWLAQEIEAGLKTTRASWEHQSAMTWPWLVDTTAAWFGPKIDAETRAELNGLAEGLKAAGVIASPAELIAYNGFIELSGYWWPTELKKIKDGPPAAVRESCSSFIATGTQTADGNVVLGHNTMMAYYDVFPNVIADIVPPHGHRILMQTCPGWIHSGTDFFVTDAGLVGAETTIGGFEGFDTNGIPEFVRMRRATQDASSIDEWCEIMKRGNNGGYANAWLLGDIHSQEIARLELGLKYVALEKKREGYFLGSNVAEDMKILRLETTANEVDIRTSSVARRVRWKQLMTRTNLRLDLALAKRFEADHFDVFKKKNQPSGRSLCAHYELDPGPVGNWPGAPYGPAGTVDAKVVDATLARQMAFGARWGSACGRAFNAARFLDQQPQFEWMKEILLSRPSQPWTVITAGEKP